MLARRHRSRRRVAALLAGVLALAPAVGTAATDLVTLLDAAEQMDPFYREAQRSALAVAEGVPQAKAALWFPRVSFNYGLNRFRQDIVNDSTFGAGGLIYFNTYDYRVNVEQPIYRADRYIELRQADKRLEQAQTEILVAHQDLMVRLAERYFDVLAAQDNLAFAEAERQSLESELEQARQRFDVGLIAITDVQEAQAGFDRATADEISARNQIDNAVEALREVTGGYDLDLAKLGTDMPLATPEPADIDAWTQRATDGNLEIAASLIETDIAKQEIRRQYTGHLPTLDAVGGYSFNKQGGRFGSIETDQYDIGLELNVPIYEGGAVVSRSRQAEYEHEAALERLEQARRSVFRQTREAYLGVIAQISSIKALKQAVLSSQTALESISAGFEVGTRT
ncbi:MAG: TolC family outer membrane protein, partial [Gammaproteobacteria bacterium]